VRWYALSALPDLDEGNHCLNLLTQAVKSDGDAAYGFSGVAEVLRLPSWQDGEAEEPT
jgi:hypothetical protein